MRKVVTNISNSLADLRKAGYIVLSYNKMDRKLIALALLGVGIAYTAQIKKNLESNL